MNPSRRGFLLGRWGRSEEEHTAEGQKENHEPTPRASVREGVGTDDRARADDGPRLPSVISWLEEHMDGSEQPAAPRPRRPASIALLRPPGAIAESEFMSACTRCGDCIEACPHGSIQEAGLRFREAEGTPYIEPLDQPCWLCEDMPCISSCEPKALRPESERLGTAQVNLLSCLNSLGTDCHVCVERCPVEGAISRAPGKVPSVYAALCVGCGVCSFSCPAPDKAIYVLPNPRRALV